MGMGLRQTTVSGTDPLCLKVSEGGPAPGTGKIESCFLVTVRTAFIGVKPKSIAVFKATSHRGEVSAPPF
jgi:hypothetical protein